MLTFHARWLQAAVVLLLVLPGLVFVHEALLLISAGTSRGLFQSQFIEDAVRLLVSDPVHAQVVLGVAGGIEPEGLAIPAPLGTFLHLTAPFFFLPPELVTPGAWVSAVFSHDSTILSLILSHALVECFLISSGVILIQSGGQLSSLVALARTGRTRQLVTVAVGVLAAGQAVGALFSPAVSPTGENLRDAGIGFFLSTVLQVNASQYSWLMDGFLPIFLPLTVVASGVGLAWLLGQLPGLFRRSVARSPEPRVGRVLVLRRLAPSAFIVVLVAAISAPFGSYFGLAHAQLMGVPPPVFAPAATLQTAPVDGTSELDSAPATFLATPTPRGALAGVTTPPAVISMPRPAQSSQPYLQQPSVSNRCVGESASWPKTDSGYTTAIQPSPGTRLLVNGQPAMLIGMNYNVNYTILPVAMRRARHERDFRILKDAGVNAVIGWGVYDEVTLQVAQEYGIGVIMPFDLDPKGAFDNARYRAEIEANFRAYVSRYKSFPAVLAWNPGGDELLHRMEVDEHRTKDKLQAAADLLVDLSRVAYTLDPNHISVVKDARDWYLPYFDQALRQARAVSGAPDPGHFLVYALNVYGTPSNIAAALDDAERTLENQLRLTMVVGEYAPFGLARQDRPTNFGLVWDVVRSRSPNGGFVYVFGPDQPNPQAPNPYDPMRLLVNEFSLVDINGTPVDDTLSVLTARWLCRAQVLSPPATRP